MKQSIIIAVALLMCCISMQGFESSVPYTVTTIGNNVFHIEDSNETNPAGHHTDASGKIIGSNNCSDMYLIVGSQKALLIDLSNKIKWADGAEEALRQIVFSRTDNLPLTITITHRHGDHTGMLSAFSDDTKVHFWIPAADFHPDDKFDFPNERTTYFEDGASFDLGGDCIIKSLTVPGHTPGSTVFFLGRDNLLFSGDAIGSGNEVWLFNKESFAVYSQGLHKLVAFLLDIENNVDQDKFTIYGGHYWQKGTKERIGMKYINDMYKLTELIASGKAQSIPSGYNTYLDTHFYYGEAGIAWNKASAEEYAIEQAQQLSDSMLPDGEFVGTGATHKDKNQDLVKLFDEHRFQSSDSRIGTLKYYLFDPIANGADPNKEYPLIVVFHGANNGMAGVLCTTDTDCAVYAGPEYQAMMGGAYILFPKANEADTEDYPEYIKVGTWRSVDPLTGTSIYIPTVASIVEEVIATHNIDKNKVVVGGTSAGGYMTWRFMAVRPDLVKGAFLIAPANNPSKEELDMYERMNIPIWVIHGRQDEICKYLLFTGPVESRLRKMKNVRISPIDTIRYGDKGIVRMVVRGMEMGQHLALFCVGANMIYDDGTPYDTNYPKGFIDWLLQIFQ